VDVQLGEPYVAVQSVGQVPGQTATVPAADRGGTDKRMANLEAELIALPASGP
jgi:hypothetical protein